MKKTISFIAINNDVLLHYSNELISIYGDEIDIKKFSIEEIKSISNINSDLVLLSSPFLMRYINNHVNSSVLFLDLCLEKKDFELLKSIKPNSKVLCLHKFRIRAIEIVNYLVELGIDHIELVPISSDDNLENIENYDLAITFLPKTYIKLNIRTIELGWRKIDISTLLGIDEKLNLHDSNVIKSIKQYSQSSISLNKKSNLFQVSTQIIRDELNNILDLVDDGIIILNSDGYILDYNLTVFKIFDLPEEILYLKEAKEFFKQILEYEEVLKEYYIKGKLFKLEKRNKYILISKQPLNNDFKNQLDILIIKDATRLINLEKYLKKEAQTKGYVAKYNFHDIIGESKIVKNTVIKAKKFAKTNLPILLLGESGTGKELLAHSIHNYSDRKNNPFIGINCMALPPNLLESELFGYEEGAFTGASKHGKEGLIELAHTGTLFLDEIGDIPLEFQGKLLRFLEENQIIKVGGSKILSLDTRIITATNKDLEQLVRENKFRKDLYYRLNILSLTLPSLKERKEDIKLIIDNNLKKFSTKKIRMADEVYNILCNYEWEGNIRELRNCIQYMMVMGHDNITVNHIPEHITKAMNKKLEVNNKLPDDDLKLITIINEILSVNRNAGRRKIVELLKTRGIKVSEYKVRKLLDELR